MYYQTVHQKRLTCGYISRTPADAAAFVRSTPFISSLVYWNCTKPYSDILNQNETEIGRSILNYYNVRYVVLHTDKMGACELEHAEDLLRGALGTSPVWYENDSIIVYDVGKGNIKRFLSRGGSWSGLEEYEGNIVSWMSSDAQLLIYSQNPDTVTVRSSLTSFSKPRTLVVYSDRTGSSSYVIPSDRFTTIDTKVDLAGGMNVIKLHVEEGCDTQYFSIHGEGRRCLGIGFRQISILDGD